MKKIALLGSTGSIGKTTLDIVSHLGEENIQVTTLAAHSNIDLLYYQAQKYRPKLIAVFDQEKAKQLQSKLPDIDVVGGMEGLIQAASFDEAEMVVSAVMGTKGILPTMAAIEAKKDVAIANKETLVSAGPLVMEKVKQNGISLIPVDSEHSAIFQCLFSGKREEVSRLILTSSGGPFRNFTNEQLENISLEQALSHPTWQMGAKITVDSSTLMNKGLEVIEACYLFDIKPEAIDVVVHPQSIIHSMVEYVDGSIIAQMGEPSMATPIQYALTYPDRQKGMIAPFDFIANNTLQFYPPDREKFPCLQLAYDALKEGGSLPAWMNAANEVLVERFLSGVIRWKEIAEKLRILMEKHSVKKIVSLQDVLEIDAQAREEAMRI